MKICETHAHLDDESFDEDRTELINNMLGESGALDCIVNVGASLEGCYASLNLAKQYDRIYAAIGVHPDDILRLTDKEMDWLYETAITNEKVVAIGEIGLDYHYPEPSKEIQREWFERQMNVAVKAGKPVIIHSREACQDTMDILKKVDAQKIGGIIHCYSYSKEAAKDFLNMNFYIGVGGVITFKNARKLVEAVEYIPMDRIVLETDCPYMAPEPHRGTRNDSRNIKYVADKIAQIKGLTSQEVIDITNANARRLFFKEK